MQRFKLCLFALYTFCAGSIGFSQNEIPKFKKITVEDGLSHSDIKAMSQDKNGFLWIGSLGGLDRYDGHQIKKFPNQNDSFNSVYNNRIYGSYAVNNYIWLVTEGGLKCFDVRKNEYSNLKWNLKTNFDPYQKITSILVTPNNTVLIINGYDLNIFTYKTEDTGVVFTELDFSDIRSLKKHATQDTDGNIWLTADEGLFLVTIIKNKATLQRAKVIASEKEFINFTGIYGKEKNYLLLGTEGGFLKVNTSLLNLKAHNLLSASFYRVIPPKEFPKTIQGIDFQISHFEKGLKNNYWFGSSFGLIKAVPNENDYDYYFLNQEVHNISLGQVESLFKDNSGCLWTSNLDGSLYIADLNQKKFVNLEYSTSVENGLAEGYIRAIAEDKYGNIWIGTEKSGLDYYNFESKKTIHFTNDPKDRNSISSNSIRSLCIDKQERIWVGTLGGVNILDKETNKFEHITSTGPVGKTITQNTIFSLDTDKFGNVWAGSWINGLNHIIIDANGDYEVEQIYKKEDTKYGLSSPTVTFIYADKYLPEVFVGTDNGLNHVFLNEDGSIKEIVHYLANEAQVSSLSSNYIWPIVRTDPSTLWLGTLGGGLNKITLNSKGYSAEVYDSDDGLQSLDVETLLYDDKSNTLWLGGLGLTKFNISTKQLKHFDKKDGLVGNTYKVGAAHKGKTGKFYFGSTEGITYFNPQEIITNSYRPNLVITDLIVNNKSATTNKLDILECDINFQKQLTLNYNENNFEFQFASLHYANPFKTKFKYKLVGYDEDWIFTTAEDRKASYNNLAYGDYIFQVTGTNSDGVWSNHIKKIQLSIKAPWWYTNIFKVLYVLLALALIALGYLSIIRWFKLKNAYDVARIEEKQKEEIYQLTGQFFTNISHEFKTPLSLILNPLEKLINQKETDNYNRTSYYKLMYSNAQRLLRLVNELIDYRKVSSNIYQLNVDKYDIVPFVNDILETFKPSAEKKNITLIPKFEQDLIYLEYDKTVLEKVIFNILGNAIKYTEPGGFIEVTISEKQPKKTVNYSSENQIVDDYVATSYLYLSIKDSGIGMSPNVIKHIFDRFFQGNNVFKESTGSGIGLTLVKSLVNLHKFNLRVFSRINTGSIFILEMPKIAYKEVFNLMEESSAIQLSSNALSLPNGVRKEKDEAQKIALYNTYAKPKILLVEDNVELRNFIKDDFESEYHIIESSNGLEALQELEEHKIQIIVSDIMMPKMDGVALCRKVKASEKLRHIPVILLTAKSAVESQIEGVQSGADMYIPKPFNLELLKYHLSNLLQNRKLLKEKVVESSFDEARKLTNENTEEDFIKQLVEIIDKNIENEKFDIDTLCSILGVSKTKLYTKVKESTSESVGSIIRRIRIKKAAQLMSSTNLTIVQVMDKIGIQSQSHFTKSFKKEFNTTPSEFLKSLNS